MTPEQARLVTTTWNQVAPIADTAATLFYDKLFELDPGLRPLFPSDLSEQKKKLMMTLGFAIGSLSRPDSASRATPAGQTTRRLRREG